MMRKKCLCGVARCTLHLGDLRKGMTYLREADDKILYRDCAKILEDMNQHSEAAVSMKMRSTGRRPRPSI